ncbi:MAG: hypothetical protein B7Z08_05250 [Sphingomonadales bacterium 32-68-7]|nr:MAG: hypothetical protein B7Z33_07360 [Sphingomonadales bacterium 12-68-11]OYX09475.1 MAG: hypothetical protein B7Z08_05250 [Sphingomonadales bacterium 32-68-7]
MVRRQPAQRGNQGMKLVAEIYCAAEEGRFAEGLSLVRQLEAEFGAAPIDDVALYLANALKDGPEILARLRKLEGAGQLVRFPPQNVTMAMSTAQRAGLGKEADAFAYEVTGSAGFQQMPVEVQGVFAAYALGHAADTATLTRVDALLPYVRSPEAAISYLTRRRYEPIWPQMEEHAGDNLARITNTFVSWTAGLLIDQPEDADRLSLHAYALLQAGRYEEAAKLANDWLDQPGSAGGLREGDGWALNVRVKALDSIGRKAEADRVFDRLAALPADENPWVVNFVINRAARLVSQGRWAEGLAATDLARPVAEKHGSPYAQMLVASYRTCALYKLDRSEEGARELEFVRAHAADASGSAAVALLCAGLEEEAVAWLARALQDENSREQVLEHLQDPRFSLDGTESSVLPSPRALIREREELLAEALKHIRILPDRFVPLAYLRRAPQ